MNVIVKEAKKKTGYVGTNALNKNHVCQLPTKVKGARKKQYKQTKKQTGHIQSDSILPFLENDGIDWII